MNTFTCPLLELLRPFGLSDLLQQVDGGAGAVNLSINIEKAGSKDRVKIYRVLHGKRDILQSLSVKLEMRFLL